MKDDVRKYIYGALTIFIVGVLTWVSIVYISSCGVTLTCNRAAFTVERTPIPTLFPATLPVLNMGGMTAAPASDICRVAAADLVGAWVSAKSPEKDAFQFSDVNGKKCEATFAEVQSLFNETIPSHSGSLSCISCHSVDLTISPAQLDLSSYAGIIAGSRRTTDAEPKSAKPKGDKPKSTDILGGGDWKKSLLYEFLVINKTDVPGHTQAAFADSFVFAGKPFVESASTATPKP